MYAKYFKRLIDLVFSVIAFTLLLPIFILIALSVWLTTRASPFFVQHRPGRNGKAFALVKFKTMNDGRDRTGELLADEHRLTGIGRFLRKTSLDEIPQLLNVIVGDMSLIGPRPLLMEYLELYSPEQRKRQDVRPGITGWAQVNGRNTLSWQEKFQYDTYYVEHITFLLDLKIFFITILKVFKTEGISGRGVATAEKFNGTN